MVQSEEIDSESFCQFKQLNLESNFQMDKLAKRTYFKSISQFEFLDQKRLGKGSFGEVRLALHLQTNKAYAIKIIDTSQALSQAAQKALERQIAFHSEISHPHIIRLWQTLRQDSKIYMIMEYAEKGNLFYYQNIKKVFTEEEASVFFTQTLSAVQYLHNLNLVHRDIKPENLLLDKDFNIKICDLGWIVEGVHQTHRTFCGTYEYMAPQMVFDRSYDHKIDIWALGVLLYELLHGYAPFQGETVVEVRESMLAGEISIDPELSENVQNLIFNILKVGPEERLTCSQIKSHSWVLEMNKKRLASTKLENQKKNQQQKMVQNQSKTHLMKSKNNLGELLQKQTNLVEKQRNRSSQKLKANLSNEQLSLAKLTKQKVKEKENIYKYLQNVSRNKKQKNWHKPQNSDISLAIKNARLITQMGKKKKTQNETIRFLTEIGQTNDTIDSKLGMKGKENSKKGIQSSNFIKKSHKGKSIRQSVD